MLLPLLALFVQDPSPTVTPRFLTDREGAALELPAEQPVFQFAVFGDRTGGPDEGVKVLAQAVDEVNLVQPDLVMTVGDLIQGYSTTAPWMAQMAEYKDIMNRLVCPWFPVAGNHDVYWRGEGRPPEEHEGHYEEHFGPLWYAFRHKNSWFLVLYTDEPNPETGERTFRKPASQRMSPEQFAWLDATLKRTQAAEHVFVFLHHPRWIGGNYGDDWERVHTRLVEAGNVEAVFAGHIHRMRYDGPRGGIEYFTLATVGGHQSGLVPEAGFLHHYYLVTVRENGVAVTSYPVGGALNPRLITAEVSNYCAALAENLLPRASTAVAFDPTKGASASPTLRWTNPLPEPVEITWSADLADGRWQFFPDHIHARVEAGESFSRELRVLRGAGPVDAAFQVPTIEVAADFIGRNLRVTLPVQSMPLDLEVSGLPVPAAPANEHTLVLDGSSAHVAIPADRVDVPDGPMTIEAWMRAEEFGSRVGLVTKTESSEYGLFVSNGRAGFSIHVDGAYVEPSSEAGRLVAGTWHHLAGVFDGKEARLYVDGELIEALPAAGIRTENSLPLIVGGDVNRSGAATSLFRGQLDELHVSQVARYSGASFRPARRHSPDDHTALLLHFDAEVGPWLYGEGLEDGWLALSGGAKIRPE